MTFVYKCILEIFFKSNNYFISIDFKIEPLMLERHLGNDILLMYDWETFSKLKESNDYVWLILHFRLVKWCLILTGFPVWWSSKVLAYNFFCLIASQLFLYHPGRGEQLWTRIWSRCPNKEPQIMFT